MQGDSAIVEERGKVYGSPAPSLANIGYAWTGVLRQHYGLELDVLPPEIVALLMNQLKVVRAATPAPYHPDNYVDGHIYLTFAEDIEREKVAG